ncbi:DUF6476 family protein [Rhodobacteraceae bacterium KMM 6894]|nr:DUF6476 family protein [Rhodobacteraceae bacterium KMM 6894]
MNAPSQPPSGDPGPLDPGMIKYLRRLVTVLSATMIIGFIVLIALFVTRFSGGQPPNLPEFPAALTLPDNATATAFTQGTDWIAVVTADDRILIYDRTSGALRQTILID